MAQRLAPSARPGPPMPVLGTMLPLRARGDGRYRPVTGGRSREAM